MATIELTLRKDGSFFVCVTKKGTVNTPIKLVVEDNQLLTEPISVEQEVNKIQQKEFSFFIVTERKDKYDFLCSKLNPTMLLLVEELESSSTCDVLVLDVAEMPNISTLSHWIKRVCQETIGQVIALIDDDVSDDDKLCLLSNGIVEYLYFSRLTAEILYEVAFKNSWRITQKQKLFGEVANKSSRHVFEKDQEQRYDVINQAPDSQELVQSSIYDIRKFSLSEKRLRLALERQEFLLYYQPQVCFKTGKVVSVEALIRWQEPEQGLIPPSQFIPIAEATLLIIDIGKWVLFEACTQAAKWHKQGFPISVAVNVAAPQFIHKGFIEIVKSALQNSGLKADFLEIEVTEGVVMHNISAVAKQLQNIRDIGVSIALDDFGTGFSSLQYLQKLPCDKLKIDRSFIMDIGLKQDDSGDKVLVENIIYLGKSFDLQVVAEGIETKEQADYLNSLGCQYAQGFYYAKPIPAEDVLLFFE